MIATTTISSSNVNAVRMRMISILTDSEFLVTEGYLTFTFTVFVFKSIAPPFFTVYSVAQES